MTIQKAVDLFAILLDKYGSPDMSAAETIDLLNMASQEYLNRLFPDNQGGIANYETDSNTASNVKPLVYNLQISMSAQGIVPNSSLNSLLAATSGDAAAKVFRLGSVSWAKTGETTIPVKWTKQNNFWAFNRNVFKRASATNPLYTLQSDGYRIAPIDQTIVLGFNVIKTPRIYTVSDLTQQFEFSDYSIYNIISIALKAAAVSIRDTEVLQDVRLSALQIAQ